ncbi:alpha/beta fold hydrolase [Actinospongicola halichondriae]|uniref:alpha/beta fold hydrolase n=1 Tax=Actinospongicola halichondriae TaxID=3236844 RepID=UPI003D37BA19
MTIADRHNVTVSGVADGPPMLFAHGFGCDQNMWRGVVPRFAATHRCILFDHAGAGHADPDTYDVDRHSSLDGYAIDVIDLCDDLGLRDVVFVGHSVSAMIGVLASIRRPDLFAHLVLVGPSARYIDDGDYVGGFTEDDIEGLLDSLDSNYLGWSAQMAPMIMGNDDRPELGHELTESFCRADPDIQRRFARVTFTSDNRDDLTSVQTPCLVLQCRNDIIAAEPVGRYVHDHLPTSEFVLLDASGHCPNLSAPDETADAIHAYLAGDSPSA